MGILQFRKDYCEFRINDEPLQPFDPSNPPDVPVGSTFAFLPRWTNVGSEDAEYTFEAEVSGPSGKFTPDFYLDPTIPRPLSPGDTAGIGFYFTVNQPGSYKATMALYEGDSLSDTWEVVICTGAGEVPAPEAGRAWVFPLVIGGFVLGVVGLRKLARKEVGR